MAFLGKEIRLKRLLNAKSGKLLAITVDHSIARGIQTGLIPIQKTIDKIVEGRPDAITMHKGIAEQCFWPHAGKVALIVKCSSFSPYQPGFDTWVTDVEEVVRLGGDAASMGCIVGGPEQPEQLKQLGLMSKQAAVYGVPFVAHIYAGEASSRRRPSTNGRTSPTLSGPGPSSAWTSSRRAIPGLPTPSRRSWKPARAASSSPAARSEIRSRTTSR